MVVEGGSSIATEQSLAWRRSLFVVTVSSSASPETGAFSTGMREHSRGGASGTEMEVLDEYGKEYGLLTFGQSYASVVTEEICAACIPPSPPATLKQQSSQGFE